MGTFKYSGAAAGNMLRKIKAGLTPAVQNAVVYKVAWVVRNRLVQQTPKKWTGQTRRYWKVRKDGPSRFTVSNDSKVMRYLEDGTRAHGPVKAKALFIPLNRRTALAGVQGVMANRKRFQYGRDYIFAKRVRGIRALKLVDRNRIFANATLKAAMNLQVRKIIRG